MTDQVLVNNNTKCFAAGSTEPKPVEDGVVRIYSMRFCPWAQRALFYAAKHGIRSEVININLKEKPEWYFKVHPEGKVPALEYNGKVVLESGLIPEFLDDTFPDSRILPTDAYEKYHQKFIIDRLASIGPGLYGLAASATDPSKKAEKYEAAENLFATAEGLLTGAFFGGSSAGYADYLLFPVFERYRVISALGFTPFSAEGFPGTKYPKLQAWYHSVQELPEVKVANQPFENIVLFMKLFFAGTPTFDIGL